MYDYEYMIVAVEELISHNVAGVICMENYKGCCFPNGFRKVFDSFCEVRDEYEKNREKYLDDSVEIVGKAKFQALCREKKEKIFKEYIAELKAIDPEINFDNAVKNYYALMEREDIQTQEMSLAIYPYLISLIMDKEEKVDSDD